MGIVGLAGIGVLDTAYLTYDHYSESDSFCNLLEGCDLVTSSVYNNLFGVPLALLGLFYYLLVTALAIYLYRQGVFGQILPVLTSLTAFGLAFSVYLTYLQYAVIGAWCQYCLLSAVLAVLLFALTFYLWLVNRRVLNKSADLLQ